MIKRVDCQTNKIQALINFGCDVAKTLEKEAISIPILFHNNSSGILLDMYYFVNDSKILYLVTFQTFIHAMDDRKEPTFPMLKQL